MKTIIKRKAKNGDHYDAIIIEGYPIDRPETGNSGLELIEDFKLEFCLKSRINFIGASYQFDSLDDLEAQLRAGDLWKELQLNLSKK